MEELLAEAYTNSLSKVKDKALIRNGLTIMKSISDKKRTSGKSTTGASKPVKAAKTAKTTTATKPAKSAKARKPPVKKRKTGEKK